MGLVDSEFYKNLYFGEPISETDFPRYEARSEDMVLTFINKTAEEVGAMPAPTLLAVRKAICAEMEYLYEYGIGVSVSGKEAGGGFTVGKVSVNNGGSSGKISSGAGSMIAPAVYAYLEQTGLLNRQVDTAPEPWPATRGWF